MTAKKSNHEVAVFFMGGETLTHEEVNIGALQYEIGGKMLAYGRFLQL
ncbi:MAG: hypothetical protein PHR10_06920 [Sphaerochaetaceae bacterium]|nr:hypothetical protein [Sphaerochaetaceae bacterium]